MKKVLLSEITSFLARGAAPKYTEKDDFYVLNQKCIRDWRVSLKDARFTDTEAKKVHDDRILRDNDILVNSTGQGTLGRVAHFLKLDRPATVDSHITIVRPTPDLVFPEYLGYVLKGRQNEIELLAEGSTGQTELSKLKLANLSIDLPPLDQQKKIANILGSLDEKIELNRRMNETLEQLGQALFRHYFVDKTKRGNNIQTLPLGERIRPKRGKSLQSKNMIHGNIPVISGGLKPAGFHNKANTVAPVITVSASGANAGFVSVWGESVWSADSSYIDSTITKHVYTYYLFLKSKQKEIYDMQTGSGQPHIYPKHIELLEIVDLSDLELDDFEQRVRPLFAMIHKNKKQIDYLSNIRDLLLPKLISGEIEV